MDPDPDPQFFYGSGSGSGWLMLSNDASKWVCDIIPVYNFINKSIVYLMRGHYKQCIVCSYGFPLPPTLKIIDLMIYVIHGLTCTRGYQNGTRG